MLPFLENSQKRTQWLYELYHEKIWSHKPPEQVTIWTSLGKTTNEACCDITSRLIEPSMVENARLVIIRCIKISMVTK